MRGRGRQAPSSGVRKASIEKNAVLNVIKEGCAIILPLITYPYVNRVLQVENMGKVTYGYSIVNYFLLIAALGISTYGVREGARNRNDHKAFETFASEIFTINLITTGISYAILLLLLFFVPRFQDYRAVILVQSISIILTTLKVDWINTVYEDFLYITVRSIIIQVFSLAGVFLFVHTPDDYLIYAGLTVIANGIVCVANQFYCRRYCRLRLVLRPEMKRHLKPMLTFFANNMAVTIYVSSDTTMLGWMAGDYYTGLYSVSVRVYQTVKQLFTAIYTVTIPRLTEYAEKKDYDAFRDTLTRVCVYIILLVVPAMAGMMAFSGEIVGIFGGASYAPAWESLCILSLALFFAMASGVLVNCINTPNGREKFSLQATGLAAAANIVLNIWFIARWKQNGASVTTLIAEMIVFIYCLVRTPDIGLFLSGKVLKRQALFGLAGAGIVFGVSLMLRALLSNGIVRLIAAIILSVTLYYLLLVRMKNPYILSLSAQVKRKMHLP